MLIYRAEGLLREMWLGRGTDFNRSARLRSVWRKAEELEIHHCTVMKKLLRLVPPDQQGALCLRGTWRPQPEPGDFPVLLLQGLRLPRWAELQRQFGGAPELSASS